MAINRNSNNPQIHEQFRIMADCAPVLLWMSRSDSLCIFFNKTWLDFTGRTLEQEWGVGWSEGIYFEDFQASMDIYLAHFNEEMPFEMEYRLKRYDGEYRWILDRGVPYYDTEGNFQGFIGSCIDITENKAMSKLLQKTNEELEQKVRERTAALKKSTSKLKHVARLQTQFVSTVSHELRTPLTAIKSSLDLIMNGVEGVVPPKMGVLLEMAQRNTNRLLRLINDTLDVEKNTSGKLFLAKKVQLLLPLIQQAMASNKLYAEKFQVHLKMGEILTDAKAAVDEDRFLQVLDNLLSNAAKFSLPNTDVFISTYRNDRHICLSVKDSGPGISSEFAPKIFSKFMQEKRQPSRPSIGTGLGLSISKSIIEQHDGILRFETSPTGSTFIIELPENDN